MTIYNVTCDSNYLKLYLFYQIQLCILNLGSRYLIITLTINQDKLFTFINHFKTTYRLKSEVEIVSKKGGICLDKTSWQGPQKKSKKARNLCQTTALMHFNVHNSSCNRRSNSESSNIMLHLKKIYSYWRCVKFISEISNSSWLYAFSIRSLCQFRVGFNKICH